MPIAYVEVSYMDDGPMNAGSHHGSIPRVEVYEIEATSEEEAINAGLARVQVNPDSRVIHARFLCWEKPTA